MPTPLPVIQTIVGAFLFLWAKKLRFLCALVIPITILFIIDIPFNFLGSDTNLENISPFIILSFTTGLLIIYLSAYTLFAVTCHRLVLIGDAGVPEYGLLRWTKREWRFLMFILLLTCIFLLFAMPIFIYPGLSKGFGIGYENFQTVFGEINIIWFLMFLSYSFIVSFKFEILNCSL